MKILKFYGYSDDTFGEYNVTNTDVDNCSSEKPIWCVIKSGGEALVVIGQYNRFHNGCWDIGIGQAYEGKSIPDWKMTFSSDDYSTVLEIEVPDDFRLVWYDNGVEVKDNA